DLERAAHRLAFAIHDLELERKREEPKSLLVDGSLLDREARLLRLGVLREAHGDRRMTRRPEELLEEPRERSARGLFEAASEVVGLDLSATEAHEVGRHPRPERRFTEDPPEHVNADRR